MKPKTKNWKELTKGEQNTFYYTFLGYSKMDAHYDLPKEYQKSCKQRQRKEEQIIRIQRHKRRM